MKITFLNVGHGDSTVIEHASGRLTVVDVNNCSELDDETLAEVSQYYQSNRALLIAEALGIRTFGMLKEAGYAINLTNPIEFLTNHHPGKDIFRYIQTHPHLDHMSGIEQLAAHNIGITNLWDTDHSFTPDLKNDADRASWNEYTRLRGSSDSPKVLRLYCDDSGSFWNQGGDNVDSGDGIDILHPNRATLQAIQHAENVNDLSYVLRITLGGVRIILAGDAENAVWDDLVARYGQDLKCSVLKASHHGRGSGYHEKAMSLMKPKYTIVSVGKKPETDASDKYRKHSENVWSTRWRGNIQITYDDAGKATISSQYAR
jgi:competence protein ComEC